MEQNEFSQHLYDIIEQMVEAAKKGKGLPQNQNEMLMDKSLTKQPISLSRLSFNDLKTTKERLGKLKEQLNQEDPTKFKNEIAKIEKVENKLNNAMEKRKDRDVNTALNTLKRNPKRQILILIDNKNKLDVLKYHLSKDPDRNKAALDKAEKLSKRLDSQISQMKSKKLNRLINIAKRNPLRFNNELNKYKQIEQKLNKQAGKAKEIGKNNDKEKAMQKTRSRQRQHSLELSR